MKKVIFLIISLVALIVFHQEVTAKKITRPTQRAVYHNNRGVKFLNVGDLKLAELEFKTAVELSPDYTEAYNNLGVIAKKSGDLRSAKVYFKKAIELDKNYAAAYSHLSMVYLDLGDLNNALSQGKIAAKRGSTFPMTHYNLGLVYLELNKEKPTKKYDKKAEYELKIATELDPLMFEAHITLARLYNAQGRYELSAIRYRLALESRPDQAHLWKELGQVYQKSGDSVKAQNAFQKASSLSGKPTKPESTTMKDALKLLNQRQYSKAIAVLKKIIAAEKNNEWAHFRLGTAYLNLGESKLAASKMDEAKRYLNSATASFKKALGLNAALTDASYNLGYTYFRMGNMALAEKTWNKTLSINPNHARTLYNLGILYSQGGDKQKAVDYLCRFALVAGDQYTKERAKALSIVSENGGKCQS